MNITKLCDFMILYDGDAGEWKLYKSKLIIIIKSKIKMYNLLVITYYSISNS